MRELTSFQNLWISTALERGSWDEEKAIWTLKLVRKGQVQHITARWVVLAVGGGSQVPLTPQYENEVSMEECVRKVRILIILLDRKFLKA